jgi:AmmeMemoRadiSam system protein B
MAYSRRAAHAGSWYEGSAAGLAAQADAILAGADGGSAAAAARLRGVIAPHAGLRWSGRVAAAAYARVREAARAQPSLKRVLLLGPSHHVRLDGLALSAAASWESPLGALRVDTAAGVALRAALAAAAVAVPLRALTRGEDEAEHSLEMQMPLLARALSAARGAGWAAGVAIFPVLVGSLSGGAAAAAAGALAPFLHCPDTLTVVSTDFAHWGERFGYTPCAARPCACGAAAAADAADDDISACIRALDAEGMQHLAALDGRSFAAYLQRTANTICGRKPLALLLDMLAAAHARGGARMCLDFVAYAQSAAVRSAQDSSVSYAAAALALRDDGAGGA